MSHGLLTEVGPDFFSYPTVPICSKVPSCSTNPATAPPLGGAMAGFTCLSAAYLTVITFTPLVEAPALT